MTGIPALPVIAIALLLVACTRGDRSRAAADGAHSADTTRVSSASPPRWATDAAKTLERQLQRELFNSSDTGFVAGARDCEEGGEDEPPPGYALVRAALADNPVVSVEASRDAHIRTVLTSVARTVHHEGGDEEEVDVDVGVKVDTADILVEKEDGAYALCYTQLFLHRGHLDWPVVRRWTPPNGSWPMVTRLADSVARAR